jgi:hypothetical protein
VVVGGGGKGFVDGGGVVFEVGGGKYVGYVPDPTKFLLAMPSNSFDVTPSSHSRYWHISLSI